MSDAYAIKSVDALESHYDAANSKSLDKEVPVLTADYRRWIEASHFFVLASAGALGLDCSPRGDSQGQLVRILDDTSLAIPDRPGNNRLDTLRNIVSDPRVGLLFMIPGVYETLRVNGRATVTTDPQLIESFTVGRQTPATVVVVEIDAVYFQCSRALNRARLWDPEGQVDRLAVPTPGDMLKGASRYFDAQAQDDALSA